MTIISNTIDVLTRLKNRNSEWKDVINRRLGSARFQNAQEEIELFESILALLDGNIPNISAKNQYIGVIQSITKRLSERDPLPGENIFPEVDQALMVYLQAADLNAMIHTLKQYQNVLFNPEVSYILGGLVEQAQQTGDVQTAKKAIVLLKLQQDCQRDGIETIFARLTQNNSNSAPSLPGGLPSEFVTYCLSGLKGSSQEKQVLFGYLTQANRHTNTPAAEKLVKTVQLALFGQNLASLGADLPEPYAAIWQEILVGLK